MSKRLFESPLAFSCALVDVTFPFLHLHSAFSTLYEVGQEFSCWDLFFFNVSDVFIWCLNLNLFVLSKTPYLDCKFLIWFRRMYLPHN